MKSSYDKALFHLGLIYCGI